MLVVSCVLRELFCVFDVCGFCVSLVWYFDSILFIRLGCFVLCLYVNACDLCGCCLCVRVVLVRFDLLVIWLTDGLGLRLWWLVVMVTWVVCRLMVVLISYCVFCFICLLVDLMFVWLFGVDIVAVCVVVMFGLFVVLLVLIACYCC